MFDIAATLATQSLGTVESHDRFGLEHYYVKFPNGRILSILRGTSPVTGQWFGNEAEGTVETAVLADDAGRLRFDDNELGNEKLSLNEEELLVEVQRVAAL